MKQCPKWHECGVYQCPHHGEHEEKYDCSRNSYCPAVHQCVKCVEIAESVPVAERKDSAA